MTYSTQHEQQEITDVPPPGWRRVLLVVGCIGVVVTLLALAVGSRGGSSNEESAGSGGSGGQGFDAGQSPPAFEEASARSDSALSDAGEVEASAVDVPLDDRAVIRAGSLSLTDTDVSGARREVLNAAGNLGGYVADEQSKADADGDLRLTDLTVQVPTDEFDAAMERFSTAGTVTGRTQSARDVTEQVVDVDTRVASAEASLRRIRLLLARAVSLGDVIRLEQVLSSRQADLESLLAQQQSLAAKTELATVQITISVPPKDPPKVEEDEEAAGFFAGLSRGWDALTSGYATLATALGTALPTLLALGLLALLGRWIARRLRRTRSPANAAA